MKYTILGAGSGLPHPDYHLSSLVFQTNQGNFLIDCGEGTSKQLIKHKFDHNFLNAIFISHYHPDHIAGIYMVLQMLYLQGRTKPLNLFLPERPAAFIETMHMFYTFEQRFPFALNVYEVLETGQYYSNISVALTDHLTGYGEFIKSQQYPNTMHSFCFNLRDDNKTLVYTSDISTFSNIQPILENADVIILDALHPDAELIISLIQIPDKYLILNHGISDKLKIWMDNNPHNNVYFAQENVTNNL